MAGGSGGGNRLEVRVRGNANQLLEKYKQLARDAHQAGDRVAAEYYLQHADHYFRVLNDSRIRQEEMRARRGIFDPLDDDGDEDEMAEAAPRDERGWRRDDERSWRRDDSSEPGDEPGVRSDSGREEAREARRDNRDSGRRAEGQEARRGPPPRAARPPRGEPAEAPPLSDGEAALMAFGGAPAEAPEAEAPAAPRRTRTRTRRTDPAPAEG
jgi:hypothetical protein